MKISRDEVFADVCCGSGTISIEMVDRGHPTQNIVMCDAGPWGFVWSEIANGKFSLTTLKRYIDATPNDPALVYGFIVELSQTPTDVDTPYIFLMLQSAAYGGKQVEIRNNRWASSYRKLWKTHNKITHTMAPIAPRLYERAAQVAEKMNGVSMRHARAEDCRWSEINVMYIDPPYEGTTGYQFSIDVSAFIAKQNCRVFVSEAKPLSENSILLTKGSAKGGMSGKRTKAHEEWLSIFDRRIQS